MILESMNQPTAVNALNREHSPNCQADICGPTTPASRGCRAQPREEKHFDHKTHQCSLTRTKRAMKSLRAQSEQEGASIGCKPWYSCEK